MRKRPWWESNPRHAFLQIAASPLDHRIRTEPAVGLEPTSSALRGRCPAGRASLAFEVAGGSRTPTTPVHSRVPQPRWVRPQYPREESNLIRDLRTVACV